MKKRNYTTLSQSNFPRELSSAQDFSLSKVSIKNIFVRSFNSLLKSFVHMQLYHVHAALMPCNMKKPTPGLAHEILGYVHGQCLRKTDARYRAFFVFVGVSQIWHTDEEMSIQVVDMEKIKVLVFVAVDIHLCRLQLRQYYDNI